MKKEQIFLFFFSLLTLAQLMMVYEIHPAYLFVVVMFASLCTTHALDAYRPASFMSTLPMIAPVVGVTVALVRGYIGGVDTSERYLYYVLASVGGYIVSLFLLTFILRQSFVISKTSITA